MDRLSIFILYLSIAVQAANGETQFKRSCLDLPRPSVYKSGSCVVLYEGNDKSRGSAATTCPNNHKNGHLALIFDQQQIDQLHAALDLTIPAWCALTRDPNDTNSWTQSDQSGTVFQLKNPPWNSNTTSAGDGAAVYKDGITKHNLTSLHPFLCQFSEPTAFPTEFKSQETGKTGSSNQSLVQWSVVSMHVYAESCAGIEACQSFSYSSRSKECQLYFAPAKQLNLSAQTGSRIFDKINQDVDCSDNCAPSNTHLLVVTGVGLNSIETYYPLEPSKGGVVATLDSTREIVALEWYDGKILIAGGSDGASNYAKSVILFDPEANSYSYVADMSVVRDRPGSTTLHGSVILCGGHNWDTDVDEYSCEKFSNYQWHSMPPMSRKRIHLMMANLKNRLFAMGGYEVGVGNVRTVERFDPESEEWTTLNDLRIDFMNAGVVVFEGEIVLCGGTPNENLCDKYDELNDQWMSMASMNQERVGFDLVIFSGALYAVGGHDASAADQQSVEVYDKEANSWSLMPTLLTVPRSYARTVVL